MKSDRYQIWKHVEFTPMKDFTLSYNMPVGDFIYTTVGMALHALAGMEAQSEYSDIKYYFIKELGCDEDSDNT